MIHREKTPKKTIVLFFPHSNPNCCVTLSLLWIKCQTTRHRKCPLCSLWSPTHPLGCRCTKECKCQDLRWSQKNLLNLATCPYKYYLWRWKCQWRLWTSSLRSRTYGMGVCVSRCSERMKMISSMVCGLLGACGSPSLSQSCVYPHGDPWLETWAVPSWHHWKSLQGTPFGASSKWIPMYVKPAWKKIDWQMQGIWYWAPDF